MADAASMCGGSYQVIGSESHSGGLLADALPGPVTWYSLYYQCGPSDGAIPEFPFHGPTFSDAMSAHMNRTAQTEAAQQARSPRNLTCTQQGVFTNCTSY